MKTSLRTLLCSMLPGLAAVAAHAGQHTNFTVAVYIPVNVVHHFSDPAVLAAEWDCIHRELPVDQVFIEVQRDRMTNDDALLEKVKAFFRGQGVATAGGMALSDGEIGGQFQSFCYTDPRDRAFIRGAAELAARHFDEVIQDDFFFNNTKYDSDLAAKGRQSWSHFRLGLMDDAAENLIVRPARAVNPRVRLIIKFPNWYEHFPGLGYDLDREPRIFDGIYTGTETRDPRMTDQHLQPYESYEIFRYFENIAPGRNGGGWVDTYSIDSVDRYAEQLWDTVFAKAPQVTLFEWSALTRPMSPDLRAAWAGQRPGFDYSALLAGGPRPVMARAAAQALAQVDQFAGRLGRPIGLASYKPFQSRGEDFLHNYLGMIGIPLDLQPQYPTNASWVLLTESARFDPDIVAKIKRGLRAGQSVVITSGLLRALQDHGLGDLVEARDNGRLFAARSFSAGFGAGNFADLAGPADDGILFPQIDFLTNDAWSLVRAGAGGNAYPLLLMDRYSKGVLYVWTMPENFADLYRLPAGVINALKDHLLTDFPVRLDSPSGVALFAYDNHTFIVESFLDTPVRVTVSVTGHPAGLDNLVTGATVAGGPADRPARWERETGAPERSGFDLTLAPHSFQAYQVLP